MRNVLTILVLGFHVVSFASCGGGGGGGGGNSSGAPTGVRVLHGAIDASPVDLLNTANGLLVSTTFFGQESVHGQLPAGDSTVSLTRAKSPSVVVATVPVTLEKNQHQTILLYGDNQSFGLSTSVISDRAVLSDKNLSAIRVVHGAVGASAVNLRIDGADVTSAVFGSASPYLEVSPGPHNVRVSRTVDNKTIFSGSVVLAPGSSYSLFSGGEMDYFTVTRFLED